MARKPSAETKQEQVNENTEKKEAKQDQTPAGATATNEVTEAEAKREEKVYNFTSSNKFLTVASLGVQFVNGKASTKDITVARALATIYGVERVE